MGKDSGVRSGKAGGVQQMQHTPLMRSSIVFTDK